MSEPTTDSILQALRWRYATKAFDPTRKIPVNIWEALEESLVLTPSSFGLQPWKFLIIENPAIRAELRSQSWGQSQVTDASHLVVFTARTDLADADIGNWIERVAEVQGSAIEALQPLHRIIGGFVSNMPTDARHAWNIRQLYIALGQLMTAGAILGIDTCPMEGIDPKGYDKVLGLEGSGYATAMACTLGYRSNDDPSATRPKVRYAAENVISRIS